MSLPNDLAHKSTDLTPGSEFGPYRVTRLLGEGAFGAVYEAVKQPLQKRVALKLLHRRWADTPQVTERFIQEARAASSLRHPHIVDVDDLGARDGVPWIAMEFLEGESMASMLDRVQFLPVGAALEYLLPIFSAVASVHAKGIIHRDLKPENIQLWKPTTGNIHPKLLDFGIAKVANRESGPSLTGAADMMGTPEYMAPEQWRSAKSVSPASDQWALAVILYRTVTGVSPFDADSAQGVMVRVSLEPPPPLSPALMLPPGFEQVLAVALEKDPTKRYPSVHAFGAALLPFAEAGTQQRWGAEFGLAGTTNAVSGRPTAPPSKPAPSMAFAKTAVSHTNDSLFRVEQQIAPTVAPSGNRRQGVGVILAIAGAAVLVVGAAIGGVKLLSSNGVAHNGVARAPDPPANTMQAAAVDAGVHVAAEPQAINDIAANSLSTSDAGRAVVAPTNRNSAGNAVANSPGNSPEISLAERLARQQAIEARTPQSVPVQQAVVPLQPTQPTQRPQETPPTNDPTPRTTPPQPHPSESLTIPNI